VAFDPTAAVIDVRTPGEHASDGHLQGDHNIPVQEIETRVADVAALSALHRRARRAG
jgi:rhodanese-related sulfurtransferase